MRCWCPHFGSWKHLIETTIATASGVMSTWGLHPCLVFLKDCSASKAEVDLSRTVRQNKESPLSNARACACAIKLFKQSIFELFSAFFRPYCACLILFLCFPLRSNEPTSHPSRARARAHLHVQGPDLVPFIWICHQPHNSNGEGGETGAEFQAIIQ